MAKTGLVNDLNTATAARRLWGGIRCQIARKPEGDGIGNPELLVADGPVTKRPASVSTNPATGPVPDARGEAAPGFSMSKQGHAGNGERAPGNPKPDTSHPRP
jgi:hypothetical protein